MTSSAAGAPASQAYASGYAQLAAPEAGQQGYQQQHQQFAGDASGQDLNALLQQQQEQRQAALAASQQQGGYEQNAPDHQDAHAQGQQSTYEPGAYQQYAPGQQVTNEHEQGVDQQHAAGQESYQQPSHGQQPAQHGLQDEHPQHVMYEQGQLPQQAADQQNLDGQQPYQTTDHHTVQGNQGRPTLSFSNTPGGIAQTATDPVWPQNTDQSSMAPQAESIHEAAGAAPVPQQAAASDAQGGILYAQGDDGQQGMTQAAEGVMSMQHEQQHVLDGGSVHSAAVNPTEYTAATSQPQEQLQQQA
jgi:hypothetical protein